MAVQANPIPFMAWLRREAPVFRDPDTGLFFITRDEDIRRVAMDPANFSNEIDPSIFRIVMGEAMERSDPEVAEILRTRGWLLPTTLLMRDPPAHTRFRRLVQEALTPKSVEQMAPALRARIGSLLDALPEAGTIEFVSDFAKRLPIWVIGRFVFGAPESDFERINAWADQFFLTIMPAAPREEYLRTVDVMIEMHHYIKANIDRLREQYDERILLSRLLRVHEQTGDAPLSDGELISMMQVMLVAGHDTTRQTLANSLYELSRRPGLQARLRAEPELMPRFINEVLRLHAAANVTPRIAARDMEVGGVAIPQGSMIFLAWGSANRDEKLHPDPDRFDIDRPDARNHLSFGWGIHHCVGAHLARAQITLSLEEILKRYERIELADPDAPLAYAPSMNVRALMQLPLRISRTDHSRH
jgi:cytochrome P450